MIEVLKMVTRVPTAGVVGGALLVVDEADPEAHPPRGFYAMNGETEWFEDLEAVEGMLHDVFPDISASPVDELPEGLPAVPTF